MMLQIRKLLLCYALYLVLNIQISLSIAQGKYAVRSDHYGAYQNYNNAHLMRYQQQPPPTLEGDRYSAEWSDGGDDDSEDQQQAYQYPAAYPTPQRAPQYNPHHQQQHQQTQQISPSQLPQSSNVYQKSPSIERPVSDPSVVVVPRLGEIRGIARYQFVNQKHVHAYLGIKYGVVGKGIARFQPATVPHFNQPINATAEAPRCPQFPDLDDIQRREERGEAVDDCLTLNIFTNDLSRLKPVLVFVHGEMLFDGGAEEGQPDYLLKHDIVLVSVNYRLAPVGFLGTQTERMPGNVALADLQLALQWIQENIQPFGGNKDNVTLIGQSGGATLIHALSLSGKAQGLFHKLILQSGTALNPYFIDEDPLGSTRNFARTARCPVSSGTRGNQELHDCLARLSTTDLLNAFKRHWDINEARGLLFTGGFKLSIGDYLGYLSEHPAALIAKTNNSYPLITGVTKDAGAFIFSRFYDQLKQMPPYNMTAFITAVLQHIAQPRHHSTWLDLAKREIFTHEDERNPTLENLSQGLLELINLVLYRGPVIDSIRYTLRKQPTFLYCFAYRGQHHRFGNIRNPLPFAIDATLSDDNVYVFPYPKEVRNLNEADRALSEQLTEAWINFVNHNQPMLNEMWPRVNSEIGPFIRISDNPSVHNRFTTELDQHFGEGIAPPNLYQQYFTTTTAATTRRPYYQQQTQNRKNNHNNYTPTHSTQNRAPYQPDYSRVPAQPYPYPQRPVSAPREN